MVPKYVHDPEKRFNEILVPTVDTVRNTWILEQMLSIKQPVLFVGDTGTSKTATIQDFLRNMDQDTHVSIVWLRTLGPATLTFDRQLHYLISLKFN